MKKFYLSLLIGFFSTGGFSQQTAGIDGDGPDSQLKKTKNEVKNLEQKLEETSNVHKRRIISIKLEKVRKERDLLQEIYDNQYQSSVQKAANEIKNLEQKLENTYVRNEKIQIAQKLEKAEQRSDMTQEKFSNSLAVYRAAATIKRIEKRLADTAVRQEKLVLPIKLEQTKKRLDSLKKFDDKISAVLKATDKVEELERQLAQQKTKNIDHDKMNKLKKAKEQLEKAKQEFASMKKQLQATNKNEKETSQANIIVQDSPKYPCGDLAVPFSKNECHLAKISSSIGSSIWRGSIRFKKNHAQHICKIDSIRISDPRPYLDYKLRIPKISPQNLKCFNLSVEWEANENITVDKDKLSAYIPRSKETDKAILKHKGTQIGTKECILPPKRWSTRPLRHVHTQ